ncbi:uncharacterized protein LOC103941161 isoform X2 [Pyrus x bretschneideri]|uniref:uncharacterized protein LOC103941161 isoform X2 n=1 Tax=Pyrus x bretschneideri TaxID=225117 RepID=UPI002030D5E1|nr:uncharacterized protein LOC103941161 isoform X2 [Pyrus x bretschneideri]
MELYRAIVKMEQEGDADGTLQDRIYRIQLDPDGLVKTLNECCKKYGLCGKHTTLTELPFGWQPGIQGAADWDEDWDKLKTKKSSSVQNERAPPLESPITASSPKDDFKSEKPQSAEAKVFENGADKNEDESAKSALNSPFASCTVGSPSREFSDSNYGMTTDADTSPRNKESQSDDRAGAGSMFSGDKGSDEPAWGTFDVNDDVDSVWGFNAVNTTKDMDQESNKDHYFSGPGEFGLNPIRIGSSQGGGFSQKSRPFTFDDSVPSTPLSAFNSGLFTAKIQG